jgi:hypothetical protein
LEGEEWQVVKPTIYDPAVGTYYNLLRLQLQAQHTPKRRSHRNPLLIRLPMTDHIILNQLAIRFEGQLPVE